MKKEVSIVNKEKFVKDNTINDLEFDLISKYIMIRMNENVSQRKLSKITGIAQSTIARIEKNVNKASLSTILKIIDALGYHIEFVKNKQKQLE